jgi:hypothetical protein
MGPWVDELSPRLAPPDYSRSTLSSGPSRWFLGEWRCVPMNETAHAVACGNGQQRRGKIIAVNGM